MENSHTYIFILNFGILVEPDALLTAFGGEHYM